MTTNGLPVTGPKCELENCSRPAAGTVCPAFLTHTRRFFVCEPCATSFGYTPRPVTEYESRTWRTEL